MMNDCPTHGGIVVNGLIALMSTVVAVIIVVRLHHWQSCGVRRSVRIGWYAVALACGFSAALSSATYFGWKVPQDYEWVIGRILVFAALLFHTVTGGPPGKAVCAVT